MPDLLPVLLLLACPLVMIVMMRGMHGRHDGHTLDEPGDDERVAELEREVARLREHRDDGGSSRS